MLSVRPSVLSATEHGLRLHRHKVPLVLAAYDSRRQRWEVSMQGLEV